MDLYVAISPIWELVLPFPPLFPVSAQRSLGTGAASTETGEWWGPLRVQRRGLREEDKGGSHLGPTTFPTSPHTPTCPKHPSTLISWSLRPLLARPAERPTPRGPAPYPLD